MMNISRNIEGIAYQCTFICRYKVFAVVGIVGIPLELGISNNRLKCLFCFDVPTLNLFTYNVHGIKIIHTTIKYSNV